jgi:hypothetical protein
MLSLNPRIRARLRAKRFGEVRRSFGEGGNLRME